MSLFAHKGNIGPEGAVTFGWMMVALASLLAAILVVARIRSGQRPYLGGLAAGVPFWVLAGWCFGFAAACRHGADPKLTWRVVMFGPPVSLGVLFHLIRRWGGRA